MLRKKNSEPAQQPDAQQELLDFENPAVQPGKKDPKQFPEPFPQLIPIRSSRW